MEHSQNSIVERANSVVQLFMAQVYGWMTCGLLLTAFVAWYTSRTPVLLQFIFSGHITFFSLIIAQFALVSVISGMINRLNGAVATSLFMLYSVLTGLTLASIFTVYSSSSIASTFIVTASMFGAMTLYSYTTKHDLSSFGSLLFMSLIGIVLALLVNSQIKSTALMSAITHIGVLIFAGLTAYDTQKLKTMGAQLSLEDKNQFRKYSIIGALSLYLNFINLFLMLLRIFSNRR